MKTIIISIGMAAMLCGCSNDVEKHIAALETQRFQLETRVGKLESDYEFLLRTMQSQTERTRDLFAAYQELSPQITNVYEALLAALQLTNSIVPAARGVSQQFFNPKLATSNGIPVGIYNSIFADAERQYPKDFDMQDYVVRKQIAAYLKLHPAK